MIIIDLSAFYIETAKLTDLKACVDHILIDAGNGNDIILTGKAPVWLYLAAAHALHGKARKLIYRSPTTGDVLIFDHDPF